MDLSMALIYIIPSNVVQKLQQELSDLFRFDFFYIGKPKKIPMYNTNTLCLESKQDKKLCHNHRRNELNELFNDMKKPVSRGTS